MRNLFPLIFSTVFILLVGVVALLMLRFLNKSWWQIKKIRRMAMIMPLFGVAMVGAWGIGEVYQINWLIVPGAIMGVLTALLEIALMLSLPFSGATHLINYLAEKATKRINKNTDKVDSVRRDILKITAAAFPLVALGESVSGVAGAFAEVDVYHKKIAFEKLPASLQGMRILHLSDIHLGHYVKLDTLALVLEDAKKHKPDVILVTGDIADNLRLLPEALNMIHHFGAPLGAMACLGNHEYFRGIKAVHRIFRDSPIPLLVDKNISLQVDQTNLTIAGIDDPVRMGAKDKAFFKSAIDTALRSSPVRLGAKNEEFYEGRIGTALNDSPEREFTILMSHRPDALDYASEAGINLVLAGHTHGGQIGIGGQSVFERIWPDRYLWGDYKLGGSHLYTSCGVGHWFPFRLGCPTEAPVIELIKSNSSS